MNRLRHIRGVLKRHPRWMLLGFATDWRRGGALAAFAAAFGGGHDLHGWYYVGAGVFYTGGAPPPPPGIFLLPCRPAGSAPNEPQ